MTVAETRHGLSGIEFFRKLLAGELPPPPMLQLLNIRLVIEGRDSGTAFVYTLPTLDTGATREVPFADFRTEDGTLFEPGSAAAKQVKTTARDTLGNSYNLTTPWEP